MNRDQRLAADGFALIEPVLFYRPDDEHGWGSNFSRHAVELVHPFTRERTFYRTGEHRFQAMKAITPDEHQFVMDAPGPGQAKMRGRQIRLRDGWGDSYADLCWYVMLEVVLAKAMQHRGVRLALTQTRGRPIYEDSPTDDIWGWRYQQSYTGKNLLGLSWMVARQTLDAAR